VSDTTIQIFYFCKSLNKIDRIKVIRDVCESNYILFSEGT